MSEYAGSSGAPIQAKATADNTIGSHVSLSDTNNKRLYELMQQLARIGDRLLGSRPEPVEKASNPEPPPGSLVLSLHRRGREASMLIGQCTDLAVRIESALGNDA